MAIYSTVFAYTSDYIKTNVIAKIADDATSFPMPAGCLNVT